MTGGPRPLPDPAQAVPLAIALMVCSVAACAVIGGLVAARIYDRIHPQGDRP